MLGAAAKMNDRSMVLLISLPPTTDPCTFVAARARCCCCLWCWCSDFCVRRPAAAHPITTTSAPTGYDSRQKILNYLLLITSVSLYEKARVVSSVLHVPSTWRPKSKIIHA